MSVTAAHCESARAYSEAHGGQAMLVMREGKVIFEGYGNGGGAERRQTLASGAKSFTGVLAAAAVEDGFIKLDAAACESLTEWKSDPVKSRITYRQLLTLTSGLTPGEAGPGSQSPAASRLNVGDHSLTLKVGDLERHYIVHVPHGYDGKNPVPVVIMFHGGSGTARGAMRETGWAQRADKEGFLAVFPNATPPDPTKPIRFGTNGQIWNDGSGRFHAGQKNIPDMAFVNAMIDDLIARFAVDRRRIYAAGFSNGASMAFRVGVELSARIAAIAPFAGALWIKQPKLDRPVSLYYITGDADPINPFEGGVPKFATGGASRDMASQAKPPAREHVATWARSIGCQAEPKPAPAAPSVTTVIYSGGRDDSEVRFTVIKDHGHVWPGSKNQLPESLVGKASDKFKATDAIWVFFTRHRLPASGQRVESATPKGSK
jgi:polyhydroxybutyrate depolymerase